MAFLVVLAPGSVVLFRWWFIFQFLPTNCSEFGGFIIANFRRPCAIEVASALWPHHRGEKRVAASALDYLPTPSAGTAARSQRHRVPGFCWGKGTKARRPWEVRRISLWQFILVVLLQRYSLAVFHRR
jgi:hypothetical protein